jgi:hypothetical protein
MLEFDGPARQFKGRSVYFDICIQDVGADA